MISTLGALRESLFVLDSLFWPLGMDLQNLNHCTFKALLKISKTFRLESGMGLVGVHVAILNLTLVLVVISRTSQRSPTTVSMSSHADIPQQSPLFERGCLSSS